MLELSVDISTLVYLDRLEQEEEVLTGQRPSVLRREEREFVRWWRRIWADRQTLSLLPPPEVHHSAVERSMVIHART
jgi:hypothetical protein